MKKYFKFLLVALMAMVFIGCDKGVNPQDDIGLAAGFAYMAGFASYWVWVVIATIGFISATYLVIRKYQNGSLDAGKGAIIFLLVLFALAVFAWLYMPLEVGANTTVEQAARGVFIGR